MRAQFIDRTIASLTKRFGRTVTFKNESGRTQSLQAGTISRSFDVATAEALVQPARKNRDVVYDISFLRANSNFVYGGHFDKELVEVTVRRAKLPEGFAIDLKTLVFIGTTAYMVSKCESDLTEGEYFWKLEVKRSDLPALAQTVISKIQSGYKLRTVNPNVVIA